MSRELKKRSDIEQMVADGEARKDPPRQIIRETSTGRIIRNDRVPEMLPPYLIAVQSNTLIYNDIDVKNFQREVSQQASRILAAMKDMQFDNAGIAYQQFIDQYDACFEMPSQGELLNVKREGTKLYAPLEHQGQRLASEFKIKELWNREAAKRFNAVTEAHINLFFYMLTLNLALYNSIDGTQKQLRIKLGQLEKRLEDLLYTFIYANNVDYIGPDYKNNASNLYGWLLLEQNDLNSALKIYRHDSDMRHRKDFNAVFEQVMSIYRWDNERLAGSIRDNAFHGHGFSDGRSEIALRLCDYLRQTAQIKEYIDELTQGSENPDADGATVDVRSLLVNAPAQIAAP